MLGTIIRGILGALVGNVATGPATGVTRVVEWGALAAVVVPLGLKLVEWWRGGGSEEIAFRIVLTWSEAAFFAFAFWLIVRIAQQATWRENPRIGFPPEQRRTFGGE